MLSGASINGLAKTLASNNSTRPSQDNAPGSYAKCLTPYLEKLREIQSTLLSYMRGTPSVSKPTHQAQSSAQPQFTVANSENKSRYPIVDDRLKNPPRIGDAFDDDDQFNEYVGGLWAKKTDFRRTMHDSSDGKDIDICVLEMGDRTEHWHKSSGKWYLKEVSEGK